MFVFNIQVFQITRQKEKRRKERNEDKRGKRKEEIKIPLNVTLAPPRSGHIQLRSLVGIAYPSSCPAK